MNQKMLYTYVGIDSHKATHTAVFIDCFFGKIGEICFNNLPSEFPAFLEDANKLKVEGTTLLFGLEDISSYGRNLLRFLKDNEQKIKHINPFLVSSERKNRNVARKSDSVDAECAARVLLSKFGEHPDVEPLDIIWTLRTIVTRRRQIVKDNTGIKSTLHSMLMCHYPNYKNFFSNIDCNSSLEFYNKYPSPNKLNGTTVEELTMFLLKTSNHYYGEAKAVEILSSIEDTTVEFQELRDESVQSSIRQLKFNIEEMEKLEIVIARALENFNTPLLYMTGFDIVSVAQLLVCIGDIKRFPKSGKLAQYAGVAPVTFASGKTDKQYSNRKGNRELNSLFYNLALRVSMPVGSSKKIVNTFFYEYYNRKLSEGKTKRQALKCVERRLVHIIWTMLTNNEEYVNPPTYDLQISVRA